MPGFCRITFQFNFKMLNTYFKVDLCRKAAIETDKFDCVCE